MKLINCKLLNKKNLIDKLIIGKIIMEIFIFNENLNNSLEATLEI